MSTSCVCCLLQPPATPLPTLGGNAKYYNWLWRVSLQSAARRQPTCRFRIHPDVRLAVGIAGRTTRPGIRFRKKNRPLTGQIRERWALKVGVDLVDLGGAVRLSVDCSTQIPPQLFVMSNL